MKRSAGVAELADALDLGSSVLRTWGFKSPLPYFDSLFDMATGVFRNC
jgi:hypothetical protein